MIAFTAKVLYTPVEKIDRPRIFVEDGHVVSVSDADNAELPRNVKVTDFGDCVLAPGLVDIHIHGAAGHDLMQANESQQQQVEFFLAHHGVTAYYPTTVTAPLDVIQSALERLADSVESSRDDRTGRAQPLGIHLEGPFLSHVRRGVHPPENLLSPSISTFDKFWQAARGHIRIMTVAPELPGAQELIAEAAKRGVSVSLGHSNADLDTTRKAVVSGARHATHTFNAMRPLDHREPGIIGEVLTNPQLTADVIADGVHVDPAIVKLLLRAKGPEGAVLITDATSATGMPDGRYWLGSMEMEVKDGKCLFNGRLAGSVLTMDKAVRNVVNFAGWDLQQSLRLATLNPAKVAGAAKKGIVAPGADADLVVLTPEGEVGATIVKGAVIHEPAGGQRNAR
jgi:N-acetylglucosamine-6-phosphate deacetylase